MKTTTFSEDELQDALDELELDANIRTDYSGRGMMGDLCFGVTHRGASVGIGAALARVCEDDLDELDRLIRAARQDSMGMDTITYFPGWQLCDGEED